MSKFGVSAEKERTLEARLRALHIHEEDLEESFIRSSGPGGQHVNKTSTCVRLVHRPTGLSVKVQSSRSQGLNRFLATASPGRSRGAATPGARIPTSRFSTIKSVGKNSGAYAAPNRSSGSRTAEHPMIHDVPDGTIPALPGHHGPHLAERQRNTLGQGTNGDTRLGMWRWRKNFAHDFLDQGRQIRLFEANSSRWDTIMFDAR